MFIPSAPAYQVVPTETYGYHHQNIPPPAPAVDEGNSRLRCTRHCQSLSASSVVSVTFDLYKPVGSLDSASVTDVQGNDELYQRNLCCM